MRRYKGYFEIVLQSFVASELARYPLTLRTSAYGYSPLCDARLRFVWQEPLPFWGASCTDKREHRCRLRADFSLSLPASLFTIRKTDCSSHRNRRRRNSGARFWYVWVLFLSGAFG